MRQHQTTIIAACLLGVVLLVMPETFAHAQHTFSIAAVDPETGEVGSAGASCVPFSATIISDLHPGVGVIHTQASYIEENQAYASALMTRGLSAAQIVDSMVANDATNQPELRQYGVVTLTGSPRSAGYTGVGCFDYKNHIVGATYAIQGNILLGHQVLDSMEARFLRATGPLADRLMAALQGANMIGADSRCAPNSSSHSAFIRVARPGDDPSAPWMALEATLGMASKQEPIDSLQTLFDAWHDALAVETRTAPNGEATLTVQPNPASGATHAIVTLAAAGAVLVELHDQRGARVAVIERAWLAAGRHEIAIETRDLANGTYFCRLTAGATVRTAALTVAHR